MAGPNDIESCCVLNLYTSKTENLYSVHMSKFDRSSLLEFLRKPRCLREVVRHFEVPTKLVDYHLQEAIKSGEVLVYRKHIPLGFLNSNAKQLRLKGLLYISRDSPRLAKDVATINSLPKTRGSATKELLHHNHKSSVFSHRKPVFLHNLMAYLKLDKAEFSRVLYNLSNKMKLTKSNRSTRRLKWETRYDSHESKSFLYAEKIRLFQALSNKPLPFLDIHRRFKISRQIVKGFVKSGLFEEVWSPKNIGVKFKLTEKGKAYLKRLERASHFEPQQRKKIFIRLKHIIFS